MWEGAERAESRKGVERRKRGRSRMGHRERGKEEEERKSSMLCRVGGAGKEVEASKGGGGKKKESSVEKG